jgi:uncharacterized protein
MKTLFYTATAVFLSLAGVIAYFALQPQASVSGPHVVLEIDASAMPAVDGDAKPSIDSYPGSNDQNSAAQPDSIASPAPEQRGDGAEAISGAPGSQPPEDYASAAVEPSSGAQQVENTPLGTSFVTTTDTVQIPSTPPGTALAGLNQDRPLFPEITPETQGSQPSAQPDTDERPVGNQPARGQALTASRDQDLPATNVAVPSASPPGPEALRTAVPLPPGVAVVRAPPALPPPIPVRRPNDIPSIEERVSTTGNSQAGVPVVEETTIAGLEIPSKPAPARVALLLRGVGRNDADSADAIGSLPSAIALGFWPYNSEGGRLAARARDRGHEVIVQLPLEPADYPARAVGPNTLMTTLPPEQNAERLEAVLKRFEGHSGVTNLMGGKMLNDKGPLKAVLEELKARGLIYVGESTSNHATVRELAREINLRFNAADVLIDAQPAPEAIDKALTRLVAIARQRGSAIGIGSATAMTVQQVHEWADTLAAQGVALVPVGALAQATGSS